MWILVEARLILWLLRRRSANPILAHAYEAIHGILWSMTRCQVTVGEVHPPLHRMCVRGGLCQEKRRKHFLMLHTMKLIVSLISGNFTRGERLSESLYFNLNRDSSKYSCWPLDLTLLTLSLALLAIHFMPITRCFYSGLPNY